MTAISLDAKGCHHNTLALTIAECMGSQWASRLATHSTIRNLTNLKVGSMEYLQR